MQPSEPSRGCAWYFGVNPPQSIIRLLQGDDTNTSNAGGLPAPNTTYTCMLVVCWPTFGQEYKYDCRSIRVCTSADCILKVNMNPSTSLRQLMNLPITGRGALYEGNWRSLATWLARDSTGVGVAGVPDGCLLPLRERDT